ncbi:MAG: SufS family cysteine desulfurase [Bdellovibrionales bacterium]|nr:SufS family cysteine desulfurase [Bdellovibrionales bacterium]
MTWNVSKVRADFPILDQKIHGKPLVYLDNAASAPRPRAVIDAVARYESESHANVHRGVHTLSQRATDLYEGARSKVRDFIGAGSDQEVVFTRGTTEGVNLVMAAWGRANVREGDDIVVLRSEHHSNFVPWQALAIEKRARLRIVELTPDLTIDWNSLKEALSGRPKILAMGLMSNVLGMLQPVAEIAAMASKAGARVFVDAAQAVAHLPLKLSELGPVDWLAFSGHKMCGPTGTGILWARRELLEQMTPWMYGGDMIRRVGDQESSWNELPWKFEAGTPNISGFVGMGAAVDYLSALGMERVHAYERTLTEKLFAELARVEGLKLWNPPLSLGGARAPLAQFTLEGVHPHDLAQFLDAEGIAVRAGHHCVQPLLSKLGVPATTRVSLSFFNEPTEIDFLVEQLGRARRYFA